MNTLYPGQPDYTGPNEGWAYWIHHEQPIEYCTSFADRLAYIRTKKPAHEQAVRLAALTCIPAEMVPPALEQAWTALDQARTALDQTRTALEQAWTAYTQAWTAYTKAETALEQAQTEARPALLTLMAELVPAALYDDHGLIFPKEEQP